MNRSQRRSTSKQSSLSTTERNPRPWQLQLTQLRLSSRRAAAASISVATALLSFASLTFAQVVPVMTGKVTWTAAEREDAPLSSVSRIAVDTKQRAFVVESKENAIYVYDAKGAFLTKFAREGGGPGEFGNPCCASFDKKGRFWVQDLNGSRYVVFTIAENGNSIKATPAFVVHAPSGNSNFSAPINFDRDGNVTSLATVRESNNPQTFVQRFVVDTAGKTVRTTKELPQTENITPPFLHQIQNGAATITLYLYQPYGGSVLRADGPEGAYALAGSGKYSVRWFSASGTVLHTLTREDQGPPLSGRERMRGDSLLVKLAKRGQTTVAGLPFGLPQSKPALRAIFFDADGRLWVERTVVDGAAHEADVYAVAGGLAFRATWPANVQLASEGFIKGNTAWGVSLDADDVPHIVRLEFSTSK